MSKPYSMLVVGDSVPWGQGLLEGQKHHHLVETWLRQRHPDWTLRKLVLAHSGAVIAVNIREPSPIQGEVPVSYPSIHTQVTTAPISDSEVDLVLLNGGVNDIDIRFILNPFTSKFDLTDAVNRHCRIAMERLLQQTVEQFPNAAVLLTNYYPFVSTQSDFSLIPELADGIGAPIPKSIPLGPAFERIVSNCLQFWIQSNQSFEDAVNRVNQIVGKKRAIYVEVPFTEENAIYAPRPWLFGLGSFFEPLDPMASTRKQQCDLNIPGADLLGRQQCYRASAGHPNEVGSQQFAAAIQTHLEQLGL